MFTLDFSQSYYNGMTADILARLASNIVSKGYWVRDTASVLEIFQAQAEAEVVPSSSLVQVRVS